MENFARELPEGYEEVYHINAADKKTGLLLNLLGIALMVIFGALCVALPFLLNVTLSFEELVESSASLILAECGLIVSMLGYIVLHELTHGVVYKKLTGQKLTFGLRWSCAFCGVPDIYTSRRVAMLALMMPAVAFSVLFIAGMAVGLVLGSWLYVFFATLFVVHASGCVGDLYMICLLLFRFKEKELLMRDTGPEQWIYVKK